jgi:hypothetical protein
VAHSDKVHLPPLVFSFNFFTLFQSTNISCLVTLQLLIADLHSTHNAPVAYKSMKANRNAFDFQLNVYPDLQVRVKRSEVKMRPLKHSSKLA